MTVDLNQYRAADATIAWIDRSDRARLDVSGPDAAKFLNNLTTNDIKRLPADRGCEAFITSPQGKTLAYVSIIVRPGSILVRADAGGLEKALPHLQKYGIFDDVAIDDVSDATLEYHIVGPDAAAWLESRGASLPGPEDLSAVATHLEGVGVLCVRESPTGRPGFTLVAKTDEGRPLGEMLRSAGLTELNSDTFETLRIEAGTPVFGREVDEKNLPQEIDRDSRTISFVKGCYLGQETVARLDALGHVNKILRGLRFHPGEPIPSPGTPLAADGKTVGSVASSAYSPGWEAGVGLAIVRVAQAAAGSALTWTRNDDGATFKAEVAELPLIPSRR
ncbi:CAF17-like 4Fe-4S cluster assembly/insertion protein YgfZ [Paludisphaera rhizosphaerae]|uniref:CAF17-like 4Fe-4S cluster assembly/insertion protein YgfZ n=1 Tax=Paludisphaera rhizosphaerae TaxID=2711216 RepID=UPI0013EDB0A3|nr:folate-binding protein YgfZ [Paludisphaera rhizosphaerae]